MYQVKIKYVPTQFANPDWNKDVYSNLRGRELTGLIRGASTFSRSVQPNVNPMDLSATFEFTYNGDLIPKDLENLIKSKIPYYYEVNVKQWVILTHFFYFVAWYKE